MARRYVTPDGKLSANAVEQRTPDGKRKPAGKHAHDRPQFAFAFLEPGYSKKRGRKIALRVVQERCGSFDAATAQVPATRGDCVSGPRPCPHVRCKHHLWLVEGDDRAGRQRERIAHELEPRWLDPATTDSCALDVADRVESRGEVASIAEIGEALGRDDSSVWLVLRAALAKVRAAGMRLEGDDE